MAESPMWVVQFRGSPFSKPLTFRVDDRVMIGRNVAGEAARVQVDLSPYDAEQLGVSRQHVQLAAEADRLMVVDQSSGNGSFLNNNRLKAGEGYRLNHGDTLMLGRMRIEVAILLAPDQGGAMQKQPSLQIHEQAKAGRGQLVLIVQPHPELAESLSQILQGAGYQTKITHEVVGAIRTYNQRRPSAVIVDRNLPDMSGLEFCRYVRRDVMQNTMPVIITGESRPENNDAADSMQAGADIFLNKPINARDLTQVVSSLILQHEAGNVGMYTKHLVGTAPLKAMPAESRKNAAVMFIAGYPDAPVPLVVNQPVSFGRAPSTGSLKTHVDLNRYDAANTGVSRLHMFLHFKQGKFFIEDADSINGTYLNGESLRARNLTEVRNGDEIRLGQLRMYIYFITEPIVDA
ncbi:MAG TPA: FHA domain-containing protein [Aggregatilineales bacterium]|nr:FHA domain-containing protein [Anaerolineae bacterium]HUN04996.1 FHA domain-containing protein [Aggregatilineales bacterium]